VIKNSPVYLVLQPI